MAVNTAVLPSVNVSSDTFTGWIAKTNNAISALTTVVVTAGLTANGDLTSGNAFVSGIFSSNTIAATSIRGGNVQTNAAISVLSNTNFTGNTVSVNGSLTIGQGLTYMASSNVATTGTSTVSIDTFSTSTYRSGKYVISVDDNVVNNYQTTEILVLQSGGNVYLTEYATLLSNNTIGTFSANIASGNVNILFTPTSTNTNLIISKTLVSV